MKVLVWHAPEENDTVQSAAATLLIGCRHGNQVTKPVCFAGAFSESRSSFVLCVCGSVFYVEK